MDDAQKKLESMLGLLKNYKNELRQIEKISEFTGVYRGQLELEESLEIARDLERELIQISKTGDASKLEEFADIIDLIKSNARKARVEIRELSLESVKENKLSSLLASKKDDVKRVQGGVTKGNSYKITSDRYLQIEKDNKELTDEVDAIRLAYNKATTDKKNLTYLGLARNEAEKTVGFTVTRKDIEAASKKTNDEINEIQKEIDELRDKMLVADDNGKKTLGRDIDSKQKKVKDKAQFRDSLPNKLGIELPGYTDITQDTLNALNRSSEPLEMVRELDLSLKLNDDEAYDILKDKSYKDYYTGIIDDLLSGIEKEKVDILGSVKTNTEFKGDLDSYTYKSGNSTDDFAKKRDELLKKIKSAKEGTNGRTQTLVSDVPKSIKAINLDEAVKEIQLDFEEYESIIKQVNEIKVEPEDNKVVDLGNKLQLAQLDNYLEELEKSVKKVDVMRNRLGKSKENFSSTDGLADAYVDLNVNEIKKATDLLGNGLNVNLTGSELGNYKKLQQLIKEIKDDSQSIQLDMRNITTDKIKESLANKDSNMREQYTRQLDEFKRELEVNGNKELGLLIAERDRASKLADIAKKNYDELMSKARTIGERKEIENRYNSVKVTKYDKDGKAYDEGTDGILETFKAITSRIDKQINMLETKLQRNGATVNPTEAKHIPLGQKTKSYEFNNMVSGELAHYKDLQVGKLTDINKLVAEYRGLEEIATNLGIKFRSINIDRLQVQLKTMPDSVKAIAMAQSTLDGLQNKINGYARSQEEANKRKAQAEKDEIARIKELYSEVSNYVNVQQIMNNSTMSYTDQVEYYTRMLPLFVENSREYINVLKLKQEAERNNQRAIDDEATRSSALIAQNNQKLVQGLQALASKITQTVNKIIGIIRTALSIISKGVTGTINTVKKLFSGVKNIINIFGSLSNRVRDNSKAFNTFNRSATELRSKILLLKGAIDYLTNNSMAQQATELYNSVYSLKNIVGKEITTNTIEWANSMERAFGISSKQLIADLNELSGVLYGLGMSSNDTALASENILMISRYLAFMGAAGGDVDQVVQKMLSGMKGMTQAIDDLGLSVRDAQMDAFLKKLKAQGGEFDNIGTSFSSMSEEARIYVRYAALIEQFTNNYDISNFEGALSSVTGRISVMKQSMYSLISTIGQVITLFTSQISSYVIVAIKLVESAVTRIAGLMGFDLTVAEDMNDTEDSVNSLVAGTGKLNNELNKVSENASKANGALGSFDRIETLSSSDSNNKDAFDYSKLMSSALDALNKKASEVNESFIDKIYGNFKNKLGNMEKDFNDFAKRITGNKEFNIGFNFQQFKKDLGNIGKELGELFNRLTSGIVKYTLIIANDFGLGVVINKLMATTSSFFNMINTMLAVSSEGFSKFYEIALKPVVEVIGTLLVNKLDRLRVAFDRISEWFNGNQSTVTGFWVKLGLWVDKTRESIGEVLIVLFERLGVILQGLLKILEPLIKRFGEFLVNEFLPWFLEKLDELGKWLNENSDKIQRLIKVISAIAWQAFKTFVDVVAKLVDIIVKHPIAVSAFFTQLLAFKVAAWGVSTAIGITQAVGSIANFSAIVAGSSLPAQFSTMAASISTSVTGIGTSIATMATSVGSTLAKMATSIGSSITSILGTIGKVATSTLGLSAIGGTIALADGIGGVTKSEEWLGKDKGSTVGGKVSSFIGGAIGGSGGGLADESTSAAQKAGEVGLNALKGAAIGGAIGSVIPGVGTAIGAAVGGVVGTITGAIGGENIAKAINGAWESVKSVSSSAWSGIKDASSVAWNSIKETTSTASQLIATGQTKLWGIIQNASVIAWTNIKQHSVTVANNVVSIWTSAKTNISSKFSSLSSVASTAWSNIKSNALSCVSNIVSAFMAIPNKIASAFSSVGNKIRSLLSLGNSGVTTSYKTSTPTIKIPKITTRATGGSVKSGSLFVASENGNPELVGSFGKGGTSVANNAMIIDAMKSAVYESTYNALAEVFSQKNSSQSGETHIHIGESGINLVDDSTINNLARILAPAMLKNNVNIANTGFKL